MLSSGTLLAVPCSRIQGCCRISSAVARLAASCKGRSKDRHDTMTLGSSVSRKLQKGTGHLAPRIPPFKSMARACEEHAGTPGDFDGWQSPEGTASPMNPTAAAHDHALSSSKQRLEQVSF